MTIQNDMTLRISVGASCMALHWENIEIRWQELLDRFSKPVRTEETMEQFRNLSRDEQLKRKDVGGFVGGVLKDGRRHNGDVLERSLLCLDADEADSGLWEDLRKLDCAWALYTTHKHRADAPRCRVVIPLAHPVTPEQFNAVSRYMASSLRISRFDRSTHEAARMMFWPSVSMDGPFDFQFGDHPFLDPDRFLAEHPDWRDVSTLPGVEREKDGKMPVRTGGRHVQDPRRKSGIVGAFCKAHSVPDVVTGMLSDVYRPSDRPNRFTYAPCDSEKGLVIYDDGLFAWSFHATDPAGGMLLNAFDLVRMHRFAPDPENGIDEKESFRLMARFAEEDRDTRIVMAKASFSEPEETGENDDWMASLQIDPKTMKIKNTEPNVEKILFNDPKLKGLTYNEFSHFLELRDDIAPLPWKHPGKYFRDQDYSQLKSYLENNYTHFSSESFDVALSKVTDDRRYHPVREYLESLPEWDGVERLDCLLIDYLGAKDNEYTRAVTRKTLVAAVRRIFQPGTKFDDMLVLTGPQGCGKSTIVARMAGKWFSDSLTLADIKDSKAACEKMQGYWILEVSELAGHGEVDTETIRAFLSRNNDIYRVAYGKVTSEHPRQSIFIGTSNKEDGFLKDETGNRRYWPVHCPGTGIRKSWTMEQDEIDLIWAEAVWREKHGETLTLEGAVADYAMRTQKENLQHDERAGNVAWFLDHEIPVEWRKLTPSTRMDYLAGMDYICSRTEESRKFRRKLVSVAEIWTECFGERIATLNAKESRAIQLILLKLGWTKLPKKQRDSQGMVRVCYQRPEETDPPEPPVGIIPVEKPDDCPY